MKWSVSGGWLARALIYSAYAMFMQPAVTVHYLGAKENADG
jgi:hypothetical protein